MSRPACPKCRSRIYEQRTHDADGNPVEEKKCIICGWSRIAPWSPPMSRTVTVAEMRRGTISDAAPCAVVGCDGEYGMSNSKYKMCAPCSIIHRRWIEKVGKGNLNEEPPFIFQEDGTWIRNGKK